MNVANGRVLLTAFFASMLAGSAMAEPASIGLYRDTRGTSCSFSGAGPGVVTVHVVFRPDSRGFRAVRFSAPVPSCFGGAWIQDIATERTNFIGDSQTGISVASSWCEDAPVEILQIQYYQNGSTSSCCEFPVQVDPFVQEIEAVDCNHVSFTPAALTSYFNANLSCLCGSNDPPVAPFNPAPAHGASGISVFTALAWTSGDPDSNLVSFDLYLGTDPDPPLHATGLTEPSFQPAIPLAELTTFYWRVVARDEWGVEQSGPAWSFTTRLTNSPPDPPHDPYPENGATGVGVLLQLWWHCQDVDAEPVVYDLYFGTNMNPPLLASGLTISQFSRSPWDDPLTWGTWHYWRVVARDPHGHETIGPLWEFRTRPANWPPDVPSQPSPPNGATFRPLNGVLTWTGGDRDAGDTVVYDVHFGTTAPPPKVTTGQTTRSYAYSALAENTVHYWQIVARDNHGAVTAGPAWSFTTQGNRNPAAPSSPAPSNGAANVSILTSLGWTCSDPDNDALKYDVYFGTVDPPPLVSSNGTGTGFSPGGLAFFTQYHWRIVARDPKGAETSGPTWAFTTRPDGAPSTPSTPSPSSGATNVAAQPTLAWQCVENDGQPMTFDVYFGDVSPPPQVAGGLTSKSYTPGVLSMSTRYYWQIVAHDNTGHQSTGPVWSFTTRVNSAPLAPSNPSPKDNGGSAASPTLTWSASDPDGNPLTYDVYFGDVSPPPLAASGLATRSYSPGWVIAPRVYYWRVVASDGLLGTSGPTWSFTTVTSGDANGDGQITILDATCAMDRFLGMPACGPDHAADVTCSSGVTPRDARCIHRRTAGMECVFCGEATAAAEPAAGPGVGVLYTWEWNDTLYCRLGVWNVPSFESFGFSVASGPDFLRAQRRGITNDFVVVRSRSYGIPGLGGGSVGGYSLTGTTAPGPAASEFIDLRFLSNGTYWVRIGAFVDDLAGAPELFFELPQPGIPVLISRFDAEPAPHGIELSWRLQSDEAMESFTLYRRANGSPPAEIARGAVEGTTGRHLDTSVSPGLAYEYELVIRTTGGDEFRSQTRRVTMAPLALVLGANHPNPFNPQTTIPYSVPSNGAVVRVRLTIYDTSGRLVRVLVDENQTGGERDVVWRGDDSSGHTVTSGVYFCVLQAGGERRTRKLVLLK